MAVDDIRPMQVDPEDSDSVGRGFQRLNQIVLRLWKIFQNFEFGDQMGSMALQNKNAVEITGGTIDGTTLGGTTGVAGTFTDLKATAKFGLVVDPAAQGAHIVDAETTHAITDPTDAPATADDLRDDLVANMIPEIKAHLNALGAKVNEIVVQRETHGLSAT